MFAQNGPSTVLAGLLMLAWCTPGWSADGAKPEVTGTEQPVAMAAASQEGPLVARESLVTEDSARATAVVGGSQPSRGVGNPTAGKRHADSRGRASYHRQGHRYSLMLGIGY